MGIGIEMENEALEQFRLTLAARLRMATMTVIQPPGTRGKRGKPTP